MARRIIVLALLLVLGAPPAVPARHGAVLLDARRATPGIQLQLVEVPATQASAALRYQLQATGIPQDVTFGVWTKDFGASFQQVLAGFRMDEAGTPVTLDRGGRPQRLDRVMLAPGPYPKGAAWEVGLVSDDGTVTSFTRVIPRPIAARDGACTVSLELVSRRGDRFIASGDGFAPGEEVSIESEGPGRIMQKRQRVNGDGRLAPDVISHSPSESDHRARYAVKSRDCVVSVGYEWGESALVRR